MTSPLQREAILHRMAEAIPTHPQGDTGSDLSSSYEALALLVHAYMSALKFRLIGFDEDMKIEEECTSLAPRLPPSWNASFGSHSFLYAHKQSAMTFVLRIDRMGNKVEVRGLALGDDKIYRFERSIRDVVRSAGLPVRITLKEDGKEDRSDLVDKLRAVFVSDDAIDGVVRDLKVNIVQKLIPKLQVEGYEETPEVSTAAGLPAQPQGPRPQQPLQPNVPRPDQPPHPYPFYDPLAEPPRRPIPAGDFPPPGFEDEHEINAPLRAAPRPGLSPFGIGQDDVHPPGLGPHDPLRQSFVPPHMGGGAPRPGGFGGMHPTFDDPLFQGPGAPGGPGGPGGQGGEFDPQAPPGARWDPVGPGGGPRPRQGGRGNPFGGFGGDII